MRPIKVDIGLIETIWIKRNKIILDPINGGYYKVNEYKYWRYYCLFSDNKN